MSEKRGHARASHIRKVDRDRISRLVCRQRTLVGTWTPFSFGTRLIQPSRRAHTQDIRHQESSYRFPKVTSNTWRKFPILHSLASSSFFFGPNFDVAASVTLFEHPYLHISPKSGILLHLRGDPKCPYPGTTIRRHRSFIGAFLPDLFSEIYQFFRYLSYSSEDGQ